MEPHSRRAAASRATLQLRRQNYPTGQLEGPAAPANATRRKLLHPAALPHRPRSPAATPLRAHLGLHSPLGASADERSWTPV